MKRQRQASRDEELAAVYDYFEEVAQQNQQLSVHANCKPMKPCGLRREGMLRAQEILHECLGNTSPSDTKEESLPCIFLRMGMEECICGRTKAGFL